MKKTLNDAVCNAAPGVKIDEMFLFREMAREFNAGGSRCTYVEEVHGRKGLVEFTSKMKGGPARVELGDLLIFTFNRFSKEMKMCVMQVKYLLPCLDILQWEMLRERPDIISHASRFNFPKNILNFNLDYLSITAYGIFYENNIDGYIDFLYTIPEQLKLKKDPALGGGSRRKFDLTCKQDIGTSNPDCRIYKSEGGRELIETCSMDAFEKEMLSYSIGAPIPVSMRGWVIGLFKSMRDRADNPEIIDDILEAYRLENDNFGNESYVYDHAPSALILSIGREKEEIE